jgi:hypothetical protein
MTRVSFVDAKLPLYGAPPCESHIRVRTYLPFRDVESAGVVLHFYYHRQSKLLEKMSEVSNSDSPGRVKAAQH